MFEFLKRKKKKSLSYHDVVVIVNGVRYPISTCGYGLLLQCNRVAGWELIDTLATTDMRQWKVIGGEFSSEKFEIYVNEIKVL